MEKLEKLSAAYKKLTGKNYSTSTLADRIILQKNTYLMQQKGIDFGYNFTWHIYGVFSFELWEKTLLTPIGDLHLENHELNSEEKEKIKELKQDRELFNFISDSNMLELFTSLLYWARQTNTAIDDTAVMQLVEKFKPRFGANEIKNAVQILKKIYS